MSDASAKQWFGHPRGLSTLFFTEMWERFSYYGMRALLVLFMTADPAQGGLGWPMSKAGPVYGLYTALVYLTNLPGGWIADRILGQRRAVLVGGLLIAAGHLCLTFHGLPFFFSGLLLIVLGTGLLKPNISTMVGSLYAEGDPRRDGGFSIFYMGINLGAFVAPLICGYLAQSESFRGFLAAQGWSPTSSWHWGFGAATVGMLLGVLQYVLTGKHLAGVGEPPPRAAGQDNPWAKLALYGGAPLALLVGLQLSGVLELSLERIFGAMDLVYLILPVIYFGYIFTRPEWTPVERKRLYTVPFFFLAAALFWSTFEQAGSTLNVFAEKSTANTVLGLSFPSTWFQSVNSIFIIALAPVFAALWTWLGHRNPSSPAKFALGLLFAGLGFLVMVGAAGARAGGAERVSPMWLISVYFIHTIGELCLSPVGLSTMTKLAPPKITGQMMGVWFLASSVGNYVGGQVAGYYERLSLGSLFFYVFLAPTIGALLLMLAIRPIARAMGGVR